MTPILLTHIFEKEWLERYPEVKFFSVHTVIVDIEHWKKLNLSREDKESLKRFLIKYLREHPNRFQYSGIDGFRVIANMTLGEREIRKPSIVPNEYKRKCLSCKTPLDVSREGICISCFDLTKEKVKCKSCSSNIVMVREEGLCFSCHFKKEKQSPN